MDNLDLDIERIFFSRNLLKNLFKVNIKKKLNSVRFVVLFTVNTNLSHSTQILFRRKFVNFFSYFF